MPAPTAATGSSAASQESIKLQWRKGPTHPSWYTAQSQKKGSITAASAESAPASDTSAPPPNLPPPSASATGDSKAPAAPRWVAPEQGPLEKKRPAAGEEHKLDHKAKQSTSRTCFGSPGLDIEKLFCGQSEACGLSRPKPKASKKASTASKLARMGPSRDDSSTMIHAMQPELTTADRESGSIWKMIGDLFDPSLTGERKAHISAEAPQQLSLIGSPSLQSDLEAELSEHFPVNHSADDGARDGNIFDAILVHEDGTNCIREGAQEHTGEGAREGAGVRAEEDGAGYSSNVPLWKPRSMSAVSVVSSLDEISAEVCTAREQSSLTCSMRGDCLLSWQRPPAYLVHLVFAFLLRAPLPRRSHWRRRVLSPVTPAVRHSGCSDPQPRDWRAFGWAGSHGCHGHDRGAPSLAGAGVREDLEQPMVFQLSEASRSRGADLCWCL